MQPRLHRRVCGDGLVNATAGEQCDNPGAVDSLGCDSDCTVAMCGDNHVNTVRGEQCDTGGNSATCDADCTPAVCGDRFLNPAAGEQCDTGGFSAWCDNDCTPAACGDGLANLQANEQCDDGNRSDEDDCLGTCRPNVCGDGKVNRQGPKRVEVCDDGNIITETECPYGTLQCTACNATCSELRTLKGRACGDGVVNDAREKCDDGNTTTETACPYGVPQCTACDAVCSAILTLTGPRCGDGVVNGPNEKCDDGNTVTETTCDDGSAQCTRCDATCSAVLTLTSPVCGDGVTNGPSEKCDDGNTLACGTCDNTCTRVQLSQASGLLTIQNRGVFFREGDTFTLDDGLHPPVVFEFDRDGSVASGHQKVPVTNGLPANQVAQSIYSAINGVGGDFQISASSIEGNYVFLTHNQHGAFGNKPILESTDSTGDVKDALLATGMSGGKGFDCPQSTGCVRNEDCAPPSPAPPPPTPARLPESPGRWESYTSHLSARED
ncbi:hypothetical protein ACN28S_50265 [Cystobacter fuscus]